ncbi:MAG: hypothetical protein AVDCRST_MAG21-1204 [uncultured Nocardioidaceae bacterium]|uniref:Uncharacterized protein n=1 Tax=uncultured Nocardioidaceae bacterium TaxID=253824 RepID=A0A6J4N2A4_9ACTN|nr:MAG: hypothetical protein AVDCRST_MAG21-1204 [uncultured Nocardioidaceae bacterium]
MKDRLSVIDPFAAVVGEEIHGLSLPLWTPWPVPEGWSFSGLAHTGEPNGVDATVSCWAGLDPFGDPAELLLVCEEAGTGVGGHFAGLDLSYPTPGVGEGAPHARFDVEGRPVPLWSVDTGDDRAAYAGEAAGRWLWVVVFPAESSSLVVQPLQLVDARQLGAELTVLPVGELSPLLWVE